MLLQVSCRSGQASHIPVVIPQTTTGPGVTCDAPTGYVTAIQLSGKGLRGPLPDSLSVLRTLRTLDLSNNSFEGALPNSWSNLTSLDVCDLSDNRLTGSLPPTYSSWSALQSLDMHRSRLTGPLPATWASMNLLTVRCAGQPLTTAGWLGHALHRTYSESSCAGLRHACVRANALTTTSGDDMQDCMAWPGRLSSFLLPACTCNSLSKQLPTWPGGGFFCAELFQR